MHEKTIQRKTVFRGRAVRVDVLEIEMADGRRSTREIVRHPGAVVVLAEHPDGRFVLVRQFRKALEASILEAVAGTLEAGEDPDACAARELREETGYEVATLRKLGVIFSAPGYSDERLHVYHALVRPVQGVPRPDEDEVLDSVHLTRAELDRKLRDGEIGDAKTLASWLLYERMADEGDTQGAIP